MGHCPFRWRLVACVYGQSCAKRSNCILQTVERAIKSSTCQREIYSKRCLRRCPIKSVCFHTVLGVYSFEICSIIWSVLIDSNLPFQNFSLTAQIFYVRTELSIFVGSGDRRCVKAHVDLRVRKMSPYGNAAVVRGHDSSLTGPCSETETRAKPFYQLSAVPSHSTNERAEKKALSAELQRSYARPSTPESRMLRSDTRLNVAGAMRETCMAACLVRRSWLDGAQIGKHPHVACTAGRSCTSRKVRAASSRKCCSRRGLLAEASAQLRSFCARAEVRFTGKTISTENGNNLALCVHRMYSHQHIR